MKAITVSALTKKYGKNAALDNVSFDVTKGSCVGLIGPNGAGKTTLIKIIAGFLHATTGEVEVYGYSPFHTNIKAKIGYMPERPEFFEERTAEFHLNFIARLRRIESDIEILSELGLDKSKKVKEFSKGMRKQLSLALATLHDPELLVLDEPTAGLDPKATIILHKTVREAIEKGGTVLISSHNLYEIEDLCDKVIFLNRTIRFKGSIGDFDTVLKIQTDDNQRAIELLKNAGINNEISGKWVITGTEDRRVIETLSKDVNIVKMETTKSLYEIFEDLQEA